MKVFDRKPHRPTRKNGREISGVSGVVLDSPNAPSLRPRVIVAGGGLVGLVAAQYLARRPYDVHVYELRGDPRDVAIPRLSSIALTLTERGLRPLEKIGIDRKIIEELATPLADRVVHHLEGPPVRMPYGVLPEHVLHSVARADLHLLLTQLAAELSNVTLHFEERFVAVDSEAGRVTFEDSQGNQHVETADLIIGADGVHSAVRAAIQREGFASLAKTYERARWLEITLDAEAIDLRALHVWPRGEVMCFALPTRNGVSVVLVIPETGPNSLETLKTEVEVRIFFRTLFPDIEAHAPRLVEEILNAEPSAFATVRTDRLHYGRVVLVGDAAHGVVPFLGQGVNCGFEDIAVLDSALAQRWHDQATALAEYTAERLPNVSALADLSEANFRELSDTVRDPMVAARRQVALLAERRFGIPTLYTQIAHSTLPYAECVAAEERRQRRARLLGAGLAARGIVVANSLRRPGR